MKYKFTKVSPECGDWEAWYLNGKLIAEGSSVDTEYILKICGLCKGLHFDVVEVTSNNEIYNAKYKCHKCGAIGTIHEEWKLEDK